MNHHEELKRTSSERNRQSTRANKTTSSSAEKKNPLRKLYLNIPAYGGGFVGALRTAVATE